MQHEKEVAYLNKLTRILEDFKTNLDERWSVVQTQMEYQRKMSREEAMNKDKIQNRVDPETKKSMYSNQEKRDIALFKILESDQTYLEYKDEYEKASKRLSELDRNLEILKREQAIVGKQVDLQVSLRNYDASVILAAQHIN